MFVFCFSSIKDTTDLIDNKFAILEAEQKLLREAEQILRQNLHNSKEFPPDGDIFDIPESASTPTKFVFPLVEPDGFSQTTSTPTDDAKVHNEHYLNNSGSVNGVREYRKSFNEQNEEQKSKLDQLKKEKKDILAVISRIKRQMAEIEIQEEELQREVSIQIA